MGIERKPSASGRKQRLSVRSNPRDLLDFPSCTIMTGRSPGLSIPPASQQYVLSDCCGFRRKTAPSRALLPSGFSAALSAITVTGSRRDLTCFPILLPEKGGTGHSVFSFPCSSLLPADMRRDKHTARSSGAFSASQPAAEGASVPANILRSCHKSFPGLSCSPIIFSIQTVLYQRPNLHPDP